MIARRSAEGWILIRQHDHGRAAGQIAAAWGAPDPPDSATVMATAHHDVAWEALDWELRWDTGRGTPLTFMDAPTVERLTAYARGIDLVEAASGMAACLCSLHYASFFADSVVEPFAAFVRAERLRQRRLQEAMRPEELAGLAQGLALLQFCDCVSLFVCRNPPGEQAITEYRDGIPWGGRLVKAQWYGPEAVRLDPSPLVREAVLSIPYRVAAGPGGPVGSGWLRVRVR